LPAGDTVLLVLCSGLNLQKTLTVLRQLAELSGPLRFLVSTGSDPLKEQKIRASFQNDSRYNIFGFSPKIAQMMRAADLVVTKPGGLIVSEALAMGAALVLFPPIPGQEQANADYAAREGAAVGLRDESDAGTALARLLSAPSDVQSMRKAAARIGKPNAAGTIVDRVAGETHASHTNL
ncbi:MAG TPA: glycosyltransferase, partial [Acidobacteriota bacterium]